MTTNLTFCQITPYLKSGKFAVARAESGQLISHHLFSLDGKFVYSVEAVQGFARERKRAYDSKVDKEARLELELDTVMDDRPIWHIVDAIRWDTDFLPFCTTETTPISHLRSFLSQQEMPTLPSPEQLPMGPPPQLHPDELAAERPSVAACGTPSGCGQPVQRSAPREPELMPPVP